MYQAKCQKIIFKNSTVLNVGLDSTFYLLADRDGGEEEEDCEGGQHANRVTGLHSESSLYAPLVCVMASNETPLSRVTLPLVIVNSLN